VLEGGEVDRRGIWTTGMSIGLVNDIAPCAELIERLMAEARTTAERPHGLRTRRPS
jgi:NAD(P)H-dependent flavin oxidoreductase YrpB (nitropropane dioxygenase family)